jgi:hypothetical protein
MFVDWDISRAASHIPGLVLRLGFIVQLHRVLANSPIPLLATKTLPLSNMERYLNSTLVPQKVHVKSYLSKIYWRIVSRSFQDQSMSKSGGLLRLIFRSAQNTDPVR